MKVNKQVEEEQRKVKRWIIKSQELQELNSFIRNVRLFCPLYSTKNS